MSTPDSAARRAQLQQVAREYFAGPMTEPLVLPHVEGFCVCDVLSPSARLWILAALRCTAMAIINALPFSSVKIAALRVLGARIGRDVYISPGVVIDPLYPSLIELDDGVLLGMGCRLLTHEYTVTSFRVGRIRIGQGSVIGAYATVRSGVSIGRRVTVGFNSFVNRDVADGLTVGGVPARTLCADSRITVAVAEQHAAVTE